MGPKVNPSAFKTCLEFFFPPPSGNSCGRLFRNQSVDCESNQIKSHISLEEDILQVLLVQSKQEKDH